MEYMTCEGSLKIEEFCLSKALMKDGDRISAARWELAVRIRSLPWVNSIPFGFGVPRTHQQGRKDWAVSRELL